MDKQGLRIEKLLRLQSYQLHLVLAQLVELTAFGATGRADAEDLKRHREMLADAKKLLTETIGKLNGEVHAENPQAAADMKQLGEQFEKPRR
jgi:hypothetical protein